MTLIDRNDLDCPIVSYESAELPAVTKVTHVLVRTRVRPVITVFVLVVLLAMSCTGGSGQHGESPSAPPGRGGTLRVAIDGWGRNGWVGPHGEWNAQLDPSYEYGSLSAWELFRCCLLRTLLSYNGLSAEQGGAEVRPDLATGMPDVSADGLTWTFQLKQGLHYAPPLENVEITTPDIVRAIERTFSPTTEAQRQLGYRYLGQNGLASYYTIIDGALDYLHRTASTISGLSTPDRYTLQVRLTHPSGDFAYRMSIPVTAPMPPNPSDPSAAFGAATGHEGGYAPFLVASGPYMVEGADKIDFSQPPSAQEPASGYTPAKETFAGKLLSPGELSLVRNPSWTDDDLRPAYPDRIDLILTGARFAASIPHDVDVGTLDFATNDTPAAQLKRYGADPTLRNQIISFPIEESDFMYLNTAVPPLDDVHVRRAVNYAIDRLTLAKLESGGISFDAGGGPPMVANHVAPDTTEALLLAGYAAYGTNPRGDLAAARREMRRSNYDSNHDGRCDDPLCVGVIIYASRTFGVAGAGTAPYGTGSQLAAVVGKDLARIGIQVRTELGSTCCITDQTKPVAIDITYGWGFDYPDPSQMFVQLFQSGAPYGFAKLGAKRGELSRWGYQVTKTPSVDDRIDGCLGKIGSAETECWAELDQYLMAEVVPIVPIQFPTAYLVVSSRVERISVDPLTGRPSLDHVVLRPST